jgi:hypothetical protein
MKDADMIFGYVDNGKTYVIDEYCTGNYGPHVEDISLGGTDDILQSGGRYQEGMTVVEFKRRMNTLDRFDKQFAPGEVASIIWGMADSTSSALKHNVAKGEGIIKFELPSNGTGPKHAEKGDKVRGVAVETLSDIERLQAFDILEEELAARKLYDAFYESSKLSIFRNISVSEQNHANSVIGLLERAHVEVPQKYIDMAVANTAPANFSNASIQAIYVEELSRGTASEIDGLSAGARFEEISISDLDAALAAAKNEDARTVYEALRTGSEKHLRSFVAALEERGVIYRPAVEQN